MHDLTALERRFVSEDSGAGDVGGLHGIWIRVLTREEHVDELMGEVWVRPAVARPLREGKVLFTGISAIDAPGGEGSDFLWKKVPEVRGLNLFRDFRFRFLCSVNHEGFALE